MDIVLLVNEYLKEKEDLRDLENDSLNIVDNQIMEWSFSNIPQPSMEELEALQESVQSKMDQEAINKEALAYLLNTDWMVIREIDSGVPCPEQVKTLRAEARAKIVK
jgi:hypothetical protein